MADDGGPVLAVYSWSVIGIIRIRKHRVLVIAIA